MNNTHYKGMATIKVGGVLTPDMAAREFEGTVHVNNPDRVENEGDVSQILANAQQHEAPNISRELAKLRHSLPFVSVEQFPIICRSVVFNPVNGILYAQELNFPDLAKVITFSSSGGADFYVSLNGNAENIGLLAAANPAQYPMGNYKNSNSRVDSILNPTRSFYCGNLKSCSVLGTVAGQVVCGQFYTMP